MNSIKNINSVDRKTWLKAIDNALSGRLKQSLVLYEKLLDKYSENTSLNYEASLLYIKESKYYEAYNCMERIYNDFQNNINYLNDFSVVCTKLSYLEKAEFLSRKALEKEPSNPNHLINLAAIYNLMGSYEKALEIIDAAIQMDPMEPKYYNLMGVALVKSGLDLVAEKMFEVAYTLDNNYIDANVNLAVLASKNGDNYKSIELLEDIITKIDKNKCDSGSINQIKYRLSFDYLSIGKLKEGWLNYDYGFDLNIEANSRRNPTRTFKKPRWDGNFVAGKKLLVWREQGIGDEIMFYTCLPDLINTGIEVIVECEERLVGVLSRSFPQFLIRKENFTYYNSENNFNEDYDYNIPVGSLMRYFRDDINKFPSNSSIFKIDENLAKFHEHNLINKNAIKKRIGICWRSGLLDMERNKNYLVIEELIPILKDDRFDFINLQYGDCEEEILKIEESLNIKIIRWSELDLKNDIDSVLALISRLDLVITAGTAVSPMAASIGKQQILIEAKSWCNLGTSYSPFFQTIDCIFPSKNRMLDECIPKVQEKLNSIFKNC